MAQFRDAGYFTPDGHLVIIDRIKDLMHLKNGARFSPMFIETNSNSALTSWRRWFWA